MNPNALNLATVLLFFLSFLLEEDFSTPTSTFFVGVFFEGAFDDDFLPLPDASESVPSEPVSTIFLFDSLDFGMFDQRSVVCDLFRFFLRRIKKRHMKNHANHQKKIIVRTIFSITRSFVCLFAPSQRMTKVDAFFLKKKQNDARLLRSR